MSVMTRRDFLRSSGAGAGLGLGAGFGLSGCAGTMAGDIAPKSGRRVVVIGGGWGGATAARYLRMADPSIEVVMLEPNREFVSCPFSNLVLSGQRTIESLTLTYDGLRGRGVKIIHDGATAIEPDTKRVRIAQGYVAYDRLVVSPGIDFQWEQIDGLAAARDTVLHAWKAGPQTVGLARQIQSMRDGGVFVLTVPPVAYRCPPGTYESVKQKDIHVIGDATTGLPVPKSGNVANNMGKAAALSIVSLLNGRAVPLMPPGNTCYSWVSDREAIAVVNAYKIENNKVVQIEQKLTPAQSVSVAQRAEGWRQSIWADMLS